MNTRRYSIFVLSYLFLLAPVLLKAQHSATIRETEKDFTTYPYSEPNPVANPTYIYPYYRFDGFTNTPVQQKWKVVELENDYIKLWVMPQLGGKIWTAIDKSTNKPFIYQNDAIKFRDIALRGPWTSGGIEANFGIIGHTPGTSAPVDYIVRKNDDGSVSCLISLLDLITQTRWNLEIRLPKDKACFTTHAFWHNKTDADQPYYSWMNLAVKAADDLKFIEPGTNHLFHDGKSYTWPYDAGHHRDLSYYKQTDFGPSQSYHITGVYSKYWGAFYQDGNYGMIHYANREDKMGKKIFLWGLSRSGAIWDKLLNDNAGQYTELQSGRLYIQNIQESVYTPYKQFSFSPYQTDSWTEYWYPYHNTSGVAIADTTGVLNLKQHGDSAAIYFSAIAPVNDTLKVFTAENKLIYSKPIKLEPLQSMQENTALNGDPISKITLGGCVLNVKDSSAKILSRSTVPLEKLDYNSAYGLYLKGRNETDTRYYDAAETDIAHALKLDPALLPALTEIAILKYKKMDYQQAFAYARKALSLDTYDGAANYYYGLAALKLGRIYDAEDGFEAASLTETYRSAAFTELSKIKIQERKFDEAVSYASKSLVYNSENITALQLEYLAARITGSKQVMEQAKEHIEALDPFNHFLRFERYWQDKSEGDKKQFTEPIRDELPQQTYLDLAIWYHDLGCDVESLAILKMAPQKDNEIDYWLAWLHRNSPNAKEWLSKAGQGSAYLVFPFRAESVPVMEWAIKNTQDWKPGYYLSLIYEAAHDHDKAKEQITRINTQTTFAPFYAIRSRLRDSTDVQGKLADLQKAANADTTDWRYTKLLTEYLIAQKQYPQALAAVENYAQRHPSNYIMGMLYTRCLMYNDRYAIAEKVIANLHVLPYEGAKDGHKFYEQTKLMLALQYIKEGKLKTASQKVAEAHEWPENLGVGAPYPDLIDNSLENSIDELIRSSAHQKPVERTLAEYAIKVKAINAM